MKSFETEQFSGRRPALDGIRALAVTAVVIYHFDGGTLSWLPGGYLGVDVFFVLSGYLITGLLIAEFDRSGRIDLFAFWIRRLRRLAPALLLMLLVVTAWIWWATPPDAYPKRRADIFWTVGYLANWHLIATTDTYFGAYTAVSPLRHAWSLAVEEQFYLVWPTIVLGLFWAGRYGLNRYGLKRMTPAQRSRVLLVTFAVIGTGLSAAWMATAYAPLKPARAYYGTQGRLQELFIGALLAVIIPLLTRRPRWVNAAAGVAVVVLVLAFGLMPDDSALFYRGGALGVSLVVAVLIIGLELRPDSVLARIFSWHPAVGLGRISYGVYLWHWPLVVAIEINDGMTTQQHIVRQALRTGITLAAALGSYFLLEKPVLRSRRVLRLPSRVVAAALVGSALVVATTIPATALPGTLARQLQLSSDTPCPGEDVDQLMACTWPLAADLSDRPVGLAVLGDSTARGLGPGLNDWADRTHGSWLQAAWKGCSASGLLALSAVGETVEPEAQLCTAQAPALIRQALATYRPPVVLVADSAVHRQPLLVNGKKLAPGTPEHGAALRAGYLDLVDQVAAYGGRVVFVELAPPGETFGPAVAAGRPAATAKPPVDGGGPHMDAFNAVLRSVAAARPGTASTMSVTDVLCPDGRCRAVRDGTLMRTDGIHYTVRFSRQLVPIMLQRIGISSRRSSVLR
jgi:peptidoglycan/LPS O-acetylase OafA/YrhL